MDKPLSGYYRSSLDAFLRILRQEHIFMVAVACLTGFLVGGAAVIFKWMIFAVYPLTFS